VAPLPELVLVLVLVPKRIAEGKRRKGAGGKGRKGAREKGREGERENGT
jgi:hypothetical protein